MKTVLIPGTMGELAAKACDVLAEREYNALVLPDIDNDDITMGYAYVDNDVCVSTVATIGQYIRALRGEQNPDGFAVLAPELCRECRSVSLGAVLARALSRADFSQIEIVPFTTADLHRCLVVDDMPEPAVGINTIGVCGVVPVITTDVFKRTVVDRLEQAGCTVVYPQLRSIVGERDVISPALRAFDAMGIKTVICVLPFGCMSGHVFARGQLRTLQKELPNLEVTILDYDPSASDINLVNRVELIVQSVRERAEGASGDAVPDEELAAPVPPLSPNMYGF